MSVLVTTLMSGIRAAASAAFITHMVETKGLDAIDHHKAKKYGEWPVETAISGGLIIARSRRTPQHLPAGPVLIQRLVVAMA